MTTAKTVGKYPVIRVIGQGAMGVVYEGFDPDTGAKVAIKVLRAEHLADHGVDSVQARFEREALATRRLHHPNIVTVHEDGVQGRIHFIVMEYLHGRELRQLMRERGRFTLDDSVFVLLQLLDALGHSHAHGVVHRDIKPTNVMVLKGLQIKVMDFGIARIESAAFTQMGTLLGTPSYMAPEQMLGVPADRRADLWAAGVMLYELLVGRSPFGGTSPLEAMRNASVLPVEPASSLVEGLPPGMDALLSRALTRRREDRFQEAAEFALELTKVVAGAGSAGGGEVEGVDLVIDPVEAPAAPQPEVDLEVDVALDLTRPAAG